MPSTKDASGDHAESAGSAHPTLLTDVVPRSDKFWWQTPHLLSLNLRLTVPLMTGYLIGFDSSMLNGIQSVPIWVDGMFSPLNVCSKAAGNTTSATLQTSTTRLGHLSLF